MKIDGQKIFVVSGYNDSVVDCVIDTYEQFKNQTSQLVDDIRAEDYETQCKSVFGYLLDNVVYREDPDGVQFVKTPARLILDGVGDCKSMSIFIGSCLHCLGIPFVFRFVGFSPRKIYNHVYIVANPGTEKEIILDAVERIDGEPVFDYARQFTVKKDIQG
jgi:hypothetical protein